MSTKILKILTAILIFSATVMLNVYSVYAVEYTINDLFGNTDSDLYCIQGGHHFYATVDGEKDRKVRVEAGRDANGNMQYRYETKTDIISDLAITGVFSKSSAHSIDSAPNKSEMEQKISYALAHGNGYYSNAQQYLWRQIRLHGGSVKNVLSGAPVSSNKGSTTGLDSQINNYIKNNKKASIKRYNTTNPVTTENHRVGPFAVEYNGTPDSVTVKGKDENGNVVTLSNSEFDIEQGGKIISASQIKNKTKFYIINKSTKEITKVKVHVKKQHTYYKVKYYVLVGKSYKVIDSRTYDRLKRLVPGTPQSMIQVKKDSSKHHTTTEAEYEFSVKIKKGNLEITKFGTWGENEESKTELLSGMKFKVYCSTLNKWIKAVDSNPITFTDSFEQAKEYTTDKNGKIKINGLYSGSYVYTLVETEGNKGYYIDPIVIEKSTSNKEKDEKVGHMTIDNKTYCTIENVTVYYKSQNVNKIKIVDDRSSGDLTIVKQDYTYNDLKLEGAEFKLQLVKGEYIGNQNKWIVNQQNGSYNYVDVNHDKYLSEKITKAGTFVTDKEGKISLTGIVNGTYKVYETKMPDGYDITKQDGYEQDDVSKENHWVYCGETTVSTADNKVEYKLDNKKIVTSLEGDVWVDKPSTKENKLNNIYDSQAEDKKYSKKDIPVILYNKKEKTVIAKTVTDENGHYAFTTKNAEEYQGEDKNIYYWDLANSYVEFRYDNIGKHDENGMVDKENPEYGYVVVNPFTGEDVTINSKAQGYKMDRDELEDSNLTGLEGAHPGKARTNPAASSITDFNEILKNEEADQAEKLLSGFYNHANFKVEHINLGLIEREEPDFSITEDIAYMKVQFGQYVYKYEYMKDDEQYKRTTVPTVNEQNTSRTFSGSIYPSDVAYNIENSTDTLKVYMVYRIYIYNNKGNGEQEDNRYVEENMYVSQLVNKFDKNRYKLSYDISDVDIEEAKRDFELWSLKSDDNVVEYNVKDEKNAYYNGIESRKAIASYVQFQLTDEAVNKILTKQLTKEELKGAPSTATATTYHEYWRTDNLWEHSSGEERYYKEYHKNREYKKGQTHYLHKSLEQTRNASELYMKFKLPEKERTISGTVFEDNQTQESVNKKTMLGNGKMDLNENRVEKTTVELISSKDATNAVTLYQHVEGANNNYETKEAKTEVPVNGTFEFKGVIPGFYYVRFTYGDGTQRLYDTQGNIVKDSSGNEIKVKSNDYKSTIISKEEIKNADQAAENDDTHVEWYKGIDKNYNTATDDTSLRESISGKEYQENADPSDTTLMKAYTPKTSITIEDDEDGDRNSSQANLNATNSDGSIGEIPHYQVFTGFNFGIIKMADTNLKLTKKIVNAEFKTQTGTTIVSDNPKQTISPYLSDLDKTTTGGSKYAKIEIDPTMIYGSEVKTTYAITVTNDSPIDYSNDEYFKYGENGRDATLTTVTNVRDLLDEKYDYNTVQIIGDVIKTGGTTVESQDAIEEPERTTETITTISDDGSETTETVKCINIKGWHSLKSEDSETIEYTVSGLLQTSNDDTLYGNEARITSIKLDRLTTLKTAFKWDDNLKEKTSLTITPTTGEDRSKLYWVIGAIALAVLATGIIVIKKKVLK